MEILEAVSREEDLGGSAERSMSVSSMVFMAGLGTVELWVLRREKGRRISRTGLGRLSFTSPRLLPGVLEVSALSDTHIWLWVFGLL